MLTKMHAHIPLLGLFAHFFLNKMFYTISLSNNLYSFLSLCLSGVLWGLGESDDAYLSIPGGCRLL